MWLYYLLKTISTLVSWLPYKLVVNIGIGIGPVSYTHLTLPTNREV